MFGFMVSLSLIWFNVCHPRCVCN